MTKEEVLKAVNYDIQKAKEIYNWLNEGVRPAPVNRDAIIEIYDDYESLRGVRVRALGEDFIIDLHDLDDAKDFTYESAANRLRDLGMDTFDKKQAAIVCIYLDEINGKLTEAGGEPFARDWYVTSRAVGCSVFYLNATRGYLNIGFSNDPSFRCRPTISLNLPN